MVRFIMPDGLWHNPEQQARAKSMVEFVMGITSFIILSIFLMWLSPDRTPLAMLIFASVCIPMVVMFALTLVLFRTTGNVRLSAHLIMLWSASCALFAISITGGPLSSPLSVFLFLLLVLGFTTLPYKDAMVWVSALSVVVGCMVLIALQRQDFMQVMQAKHLFMNSVIAWCVVLLLVFNLLRNNMMVLDALAFERDRSDKQVAYLQEFDVLTGLHTRKSFLLKMAEAVELHKRYKNRFGVFVVNAKGFGDINVQHGVLFGDHMLVQISQRLTELVERVNGTVAHLGADEWGVIVPNMVLLEDGSRWAKEIKNTLSGTYTKETHSVTLQVVVGYSVYPDHSECKDALLIQAVQRLRERKSIDHRFNGPYLQNA